MTHTQRWHAHHGTSGTGHLYQGRFKSFPIQSDEHLWTVLRYVERNPLRAGLVKRAEQWRWGSLWRRGFGDDESRSLLAEGPLKLPRNWIASVNRAQTAGEVAALRASVQPAVNPSARKLGSRRPPPRSTSNTLFAPVDGLASPSS